MTEPTFPIAVLPLRERPQPADLAPLMRGVRAARESVRVLGGQVVADGRPYAAAPPMARELTHIMTTGATLVRIQVNNLQILPPEWREMHLRTAALADRVALQLGGADDAAAAVQAAHQLQCYDLRHRELVRGEWQPDAIHWETALGEDPATGSREYVRQEYPLWLTTRQACGGSDDAS